MELPVQLLNSLRHVKGFDKKAFEQVHEFPEQITSIRVNRAKNYKLQTTNYKLSPVPWCSTGFYLGQRPSFTFDPLFHAGCYYVQEASSMFLEQALKQTVDLSLPIRMLDLSAAPGGKSTHIHSLITSDSLLVSNDVIRSRASILKDNIIKWGCTNVIVTNNDPQDFRRMENYFDVIVIDAPCSGSGLFRRDTAAIAEWSENNVQLCSQRQQRIIADVWPALKKEGILVYSTCSYSEAEDEAIGTWLTNHFDASYRALQVDKAWGIVETEFGYRFWPDKVKGEGFFIGCFQKISGEDASKPFRKKNRLLDADKREMGIISNWADMESANLVKHDNQFYRWPASLADDFHYIIDSLRVMYSGVLTGELIRDKFIPAHALAMSLCMKKTVPRIELNYEESIRYLQRKIPDIPVKEKGWQVVTYNDYILGWVNVLTGRINNYYPKELRIIKDN